MPTTTDRDININLKAKDEASEQIKKVENSLKSLESELNTLYETMTNMSALLGLNILHEFGGLATEVVEVNNRLKLLNDTVLQTGLNFQNLIQASNRSRTSLREFGEQFTRIGMTAGSYFQDDPTQLLKVVETLNKQFQLMHLNATQLGSVQTEVLNAIEVGYFGTQQLKSIQMHDNPLIKGFINSREEWRGKSLEELGSSKQLTTKDFFEYLASSSEQINKEFQNMTMTLEQIGVVMKNEVIDIFSDFFIYVTNIANGIVRIYENIKNNHPVIYGVIRSLIQTITLVTALATVLRSVLLITTMIKAVMGGWVGLVAGVVGGGALAGLSAYNIYKGTHSDLSAPPSAGMSTTELHLKNIETEVKSINNKVGLERDTLNDLVSRSENLFLQKNYNMSSDSSYNFDISEALAESLRRDLKTNGMRNSNV